MYYYNIVICHNIFLRLNCIIKGKEVGSQSLKIPFWLCRWLCYDIYEEEYIIYLFILNNLIISY